MYEGKAVACDDKVGVVPYEEVGVALSLPVYKISSVSGTLDRSALPRHP